MKEGASVNRWLVLVLVCVAQFMVVLDATIVNVALPSIQHGLHFSATSLQWVVNVYTLFFGGFLLLGGRASDLFGRQRLFMGGLAVFTIASLVNGLAGSSGLLIAGRALQGLGPALVWPHAWSVRARRCPSRGVRRHRVAVEGTADPARDLPRPFAD